MREDWKLGLESSYEKKEGGAVWRVISGELEGFLVDTVNEAWFREEFALWSQDPSYDDGNWRRESYWHFYLGYYVPMYVASLQKALIELAPMRSGGTLRVLDIGAGPGTTALALLDLANMAERYGLEPTLGIELTCVDRDGAKLRFAKANVHEFSRRLAPRTRQLASGCVKGERWRVADMVDVLSGLDTRFDLVILGNVLRESQVLCHSLREGILTQRLGGGRPLSRLAGDGVLFATEQGQLGVAGLESANTLCSLRTKMIKLGLSPLEPQSSRCHDCRGVTGVDDCQCTHPYRIKWPEYYVEWTGGKPRDSKIRSMWVAMQASAENEAS